MYGAATLALLVWGIPSSKSTQVRGRIINNLIYAIFALIYVALCGLPTWIKPRLSAHKERLDLKSESVSLLQSLRQSPLTEGVNIDTKNDRFSLAE